MTIEVTRVVLLWCTVINYGVLLVWFLVFVFAHDWIQRIHGRWFRVSREQFDALHYAGMSIFKIGIILFNLVPFVVLFIFR
jgi:ABC-type branched-subunit amino acid transport system permease subunit